MASLIEELIIILEEEATVYDELVEVVNYKTRVIIENNLQKLQDVTAMEQDKVQDITSLENKRRQVLQNMAIVLNQKPEVLNLKHLIECLKNQPIEQKQLCILHDRLTKTIHKLMEINNRNKSLIEQSLEMIEFNMNLIQSTRMSPGNNNYSKGAMNVGPSSGQTRMFDAKQ